MTRFTITAVAIVGALCIVGRAQSVCLPSPHLLTTSPLGGQAGTTVELAITGENIDDLEALRFSHPGLTAEPKRDDSGQIVPNRFVMSIAADCPIGLHEARVLTRLGISSSRVFSVGELPETTRGEANTSLEKATPLPLDTVCNASVTKQAVDHYALEVPSGQRVVIECAARGIDSKATPVLILADTDGNDLQVERRGGSIDYTPESGGRFIVKVHDLTFSGGPEFFYRLAALTAAAGEPVAQFPATHTVSTFSWPPVGLPGTAALTEPEPLSTLNSQPSTPQPVTLPLDLAGRFYPAADVDTFEFTAKKGETWWVEVASERLGRPTDPTVVVQRFTREGDNETLTDVAELSDIASPVKVSSNGYAYDGPPYHAGSADINGKFDVPEDGTYRLQITDLFGGTRSDPANEYRLIVRQAQPDFALVGWPLHMELRNGDRNALTKPIALRCGATLAFEVVVLRRDGFDGEIELVMQNLPTGVTATGLKIPKGKSRGILLFTADQNAPRGIAQATFAGRATINGETVTRPGRFAELAWPIRDVWSEIPHPRLLTTIPVSVSGHEFAPLSIAPADDKVWEAKAGETLTVPLVHTRRCEFSGKTISLKTFGECFDTNAAFECALDAESSQATLDLAKLKTPPGEYVIAFYASAVAKYCHRPDLATAAEMELAEVKARAEAAAIEAKTAVEAAQSATEEQKPALAEAAAAAAEKQKIADAEVAAADKKLKDATAAAQPKDIADIVVSAPIRIRVLPVEEVAKP